MRKRLFSAPGVLTPRAVATIVAVVAIMMILSACGHGGGGY